eukprot:g28010.t1
MDEAEAIEARVMRSKKATTVEDIEAEILLLNGKHEAPQKKIEALQKKKKKIEIMRQAWETRKQQAQRKREHDKHEEQRRQKRQRTDTEFKKYCEWIRNGGARGLTAKKEILDKMDKLIMAGHTHEEALKAVKL